MKTSEIIEDALEERGFVPDSGGVLDDPNGEVAALFFGNVRFEIYEEIPRIEISGESGSFICHRFDLHDPSSIEMFNALGRCIEKNCNTCPNMNKTNWMRGSDRKWQTFDYRR